MQHVEKHSSVSAGLREIVLGMSDGLIVPFALAAGLSGAVGSNSLVLLAGFAELIAGSISMGLGGYLAGKTERDQYYGERAREETEVEKIPQVEQKEVKDILSVYGISESTLTLFVRELATNKQNWIDFMMRFELGLEKPTLSDARKSAIRIGLSYAAGGFVPLLGYVFTQTPKEGLILSSVLSLVALSSFGAWKSQLTGKPILRGAVQVTLTGFVAAGAAYFFARLVQG